MSTATSRAPRIRLGFFGNASFAASDPHIPRPLAEASLQLLESVKPIGFFNVAADDPPSL